MHVYIPIYIHEPTGILCDVHAKTPTAGENPRASPVETNATRIPSELGLQFAFASRVAHSTPRRARRSRPSTFGASNALKHSRNAHDGRQGARRSSKPAAKKPAAKKKAAPKKKPAVKKTTATKKKAAPKKKPAGAYE